MELLITHGSHTLLGDSYDVLYDEKWAPFACHEVRFLWPGVPRATDGYAF